MAYFCSRLTVYAVFAGIVFADYEETWVSVRAVLGVPLGILSVVIAAEVQALWVMKHRHRAWFRLRSSI